MVDRHAIMDVLRGIDDPEMPISIVDLGIVENVRVEPEGSNARVAVTILPTFVGCPALEMIREEIEREVGALEGVDDVEVTFINDPPWSPDRITDTGRESLRGHGVTVPDRIDTAHRRNARPTVSTIGTSAVACPFCASTSTRLDSPFGPTRCRTIYYCEACHNSFERIKKLA